jgi:hypothetical protein
LGCGLLSVRREATDRATICWYQRRRCYDQLVNVGGMQAYFAHDAHKSGGVTLSHVRVAAEPIRAPYEIQVGVREARLGWETPTRVRKGYGRERPARELQRCLCRPPLPPSLASPQKEREREPSAWVQDSRRGVEVQRRRVRRSMWRCTMRRTPPSSTSSSTCAARASSYSTRPHPPPPSSTSCCRRACGCGSRSCVRRYGWLGDASSLLGGRD